MLTESLKRSTRKVSSFAERMGEDYMTQEHMVICLTYDEDFIAMARAFDINVDRIKNTLFTELYPNSQIAELDATYDEGERIPRVKVTNAWQTLVMNCQIRVEAAGREQVTGLDMTFGIFKEEETRRMKLLLEQNGIREQELIRFMSTGEAPEQPKTPLEAFCINLSEMAAEGKIDTIIGRDKEISRCFQTLLRKRKSNPLLVGDPGVGKTAIAEGLALRIHDKETPKELEDHTVYSLSMGFLVAGTRCRGDFEERLEALVKQIEETPNTILFIDEAHTIIGAGAVSSGAMGAADILKPAMQKGTLRCVGATTNAEYRKYIEADRAFSRRFQRIDVYEPSEEETLLILQGIKKHYEEHHSVEYTDEALETTIKLSAQYLGSKRFPDKAIDIIDEVGAGNKLRKEEERKKVIGKEDIEDTFAVIARIPPKKMNRKDATVIKDLETNLKSLIYGQDSAIESLVNAVKLSRAGLRDKSKPIGSYLFSGPTGVGKTEVTRQLAENLGVRLLRFDMSEFMEKHTVSRLIGAPPGYIGFDKGGQLTDGVDENPHSVVLLDEIEKAHPDVSNVLLQVMDYGKLSDHSGRETDFRNTVIVMTTNAGAREMAKESVGFSRDKRKGEDKIALEELFSPEFRNRLDAIIDFAPLEIDSISRVVKKFISQLEGQLAERNIKIMISQEAAEWLGTEGYDPDMGARPLARLIEEKIKKPLADEILIGDLMQGGSVNIELKDGELKFKINSLNNKKNKKGVKVDEPRL